MEKRTITITKVDGKIQYLSDIYSQIETNTILKKTITGIGATYSEIKASRHSIIIEPTKPVIYGKINDSKHQKDNLKGVFERVYQDEIADYIETSLRKNKWIKILTTPESFKKVQNAFESLDINIQSDGYFLLFDEVHRTIKDSGYRDNITLPMDFFFGCKDKAIVSATLPKKIVDKRLKDFQIVELVPDFDYKKDMTLYATNNVLQRTRELFKLLENENNPIFVFVNSISIINSMMKQIGIYDKSAVFCSSKSVGNINSKDFNSAYEYWDKNKMARYNWMTSRFYSALDIELSEAPNVVMLTDCYTAEYTMIDPYMDAVQIVGRFRNGVNRIYHISNFNRNIPIQSRDDLKEEFIAMEKVYNCLKTMAKSAPTETQRQAFTDVLAVIPYSMFLKENGKRDPYKIDNYLNDGVVKSLYNDSSRLLDAYKEGDFFSVNYEHIIYSYGDYERLKIERNTTSLKEKRKDIVLQLEQLGDCYTEEKSQLRRELEFADRFIVEAYDVLGKDEIERLNYSYSKIKVAMDLKRHQEGAHSTDAINLINDYFYIQQWYSVKNIKSKLIEIFKQLNIPTKGVTAQTIKDYFEVVDRRTSKKRGFILVKSLFVRK